MPNLENLESLCLTKKRVLESLKIPTDEIKPELLAEQYEKDIILNAINLRILSLKYKTASKNKSTKQTLAKKKLNALEKKIKAIEVEKVEAEAKARALREELARKKESIDEEKKKYKDKLGILQSEVNLGKEELEIKKIQIEDAAKDLQELEKLFSGMNEINKSIERKMEEKRAEGNEMSDKYYELAMNSEDIHEVERMYSETAVEKRRLIEEVESKSMRMKKVEIFYNKIKSYPKKISELFQSLQESSRFLENIIDEREISASLISSHALIAELKEIFQVSLSSRLTISEKDPIDYDIELEEALNRLNTLNKSISTLETSSKNSSLNEIKKLASTSQEKNTQKIQQISQEIQNFVENYQTTRLSLEAQLKESQEKEVQIIQTKIKTDTIISKVTVLHNLKKSEINKQESLKNEINTLMKQEDKSKSSIHDKDTYVNEKKLTNLVTQVTAIHEEIMKKDTQIIKRTRESMNVEALISQIEENIQNIDAKIRETKEILYNRVSEDISKKDKEIDMLKEIVRGNASEIKSKDATLTGIKKLLNDNISTPKTLKDIRKTSSK